MIRSYRLIRNNWRRNHRHHGGARAVARCLAGTLVVKSGLLRLRRETPTVEILSFSVVPWMTALWARLAGRASSGVSAEILIGDCSGGLGAPHRRLAGSSLRVIPCLNAHHGKKIDLFLSRVCRAPYVVIADDDVFWLGREPLAWALAELEADPLTAAVSLWPRRRPSRVMRLEGIEQPMGSHCVMIRRALWHREGLSFAVAPPPPGAGEWFYDTADLANCEILKRGYRIASAAPDTRRHLAAFDGASSWILKLQGHSPEELLAVAAEYPERQKKAWQAILIARGLTLLVAKIIPGSATPEIVSAQRLDTAERVLADLMPTGDRTAARQEVEETLRRLHERLHQPPERSQVHAPRRGAPA